MNTYFRCEDMCFTFHGDPHRQHARDTDQLANKCTLRLHQTHLKVAVRERERQTT